MHFFTHFLHKIALFLHLKNCWVSPNLLTVEIDDDKWGGVNTGTQDKLELVGEVEKKYNSTELDVDSVRKL